MILLCKAGGTHASEHSQKMCNSLSESAHDLRNTGAMWQVEKNTILEMAPHKQPADCKGRFGNLPKIKSFPRHFGADIHRALIYVGVNAPEQDSRCISRRRNTPQKHAPVPASRCDSVHIWSLFCRAPLSLTSCGIGLVAASALTATTYHKALKKIHGHGRTGSLALSLANTCQRLWVASWMTSTRSL